MKTALISLYDKSGLDSLLESLDRHDFRIISSGGTYEKIKEIRDQHNYKFDLINVSEYTGFPELLEGRVKTLHPKIHGGILFDTKNPKHNLDAEKYGIEKIDLVVCNFYPFERIAKESSSEEEIREGIDIGGPTMIMSAVKNKVPSICNPEQYDELAKVLDENEGEFPEAYVEELNRLASNNIANYRSSNAVELDRLAGKKTKRIGMKEGKELRYGENHHQHATLYDSSVSVFGGKGLSYNNVLDGDAALSAIESIEDFSDLKKAAVIKHQNPCGLAVAPSLKEAFELAWDSDPVSAYGSIVGFDSKVDVETAESIINRFIEVVVAPEYSEDALEILLRKKNLRIVKYKSIPKIEMELRSTRLGVLEQEIDDEIYPLNFDELYRGEFKFEGQKLGFVSGLPEPELKGLYDFGYRSVKSVKSNAVTASRKIDESRYQLIGVGAGQPNRVQSIRLALDHALKRDDVNPEDIVVASDAFFPHRDNIEVIGKSGVKHVVQPGGSIKDKEIIDIAKNYEINMLFTGRRHFRH